MPMASQDDQRLSLQLGRDVGSREVYDGFAVWFRVRVFRV